MDYSKENLSFIFHETSHGQLRAGVGGWWVVCVGGPGVGWGWLGCVGGGSLLGCTECAFTISRESFR